MNLKKHLKLFNIYWILFFLSISGCTMIYVPNMQNIPMFEKKNNINTTITPRNAQLSYSLTNHIGIVADGLYSNTPSIDMSSGKTGDWWEKRYCYEFGAGYFKKFNEKTSFEIFGGIGKGYSSYYYTISSHMEREGGKVNYYKYYLQPNYCKHFKKINFAISTRISVIDIYDFKDINNHKIDVGYVPFFEPCFTIKIRLKDYLYFALQNQWSQPLIFTLQKNASNPALQYEFESTYHQLYYHTINLSFGLELKFDKLFKQKNDNSAI